VESKLGSGGFISAAMRHGIEMESVAAEAYRQHLLAALPEGSSVEIEETGFWVHSQMPHIGASPDRRVRIIIDGTEQPVKYVQIKCPHSKALDSFKSLPDIIAVQVITELAVLDSHQAAKAAAAEEDIFIWKADEAPVLHTLRWAEVRQRWFAKILPKLNAFYFRLLQPQLSRKRLQSQAAGVSASQRSSTEATPVKLNLNAQLQIAAANQMAATAAAAAEQAAAARAAGVSLLSPIQVISPELRPGKRVLQAKGSKQGTVQSVERDRVVVVWDEDTAAGMGPPDDGGMDAERKAKRRRPTAAANLTIIPIDVSCNKFGLMLGKHEGEPVVVVSGTHAGKLGICGIQTGQKYRVMLDGCSQTVSIAASQLRRKLPKEETATCSADHPCKVMFHIVLPLL
jgi:hypothetical protein